MSSVSNNPFFAAGIAGHQEARAELARLAAERKASTINRALEQEYDLPWDGIAFNRKAPAPVPVPTTDNTRRKQLLLIC